MMFVIPSMVYAGGYQVRLQGNKQNGFGLIGSPLYFGASNIFFNPGGIAFMTNTMDISFGSSFVFANATFRENGSNYSADSDNPITTPAYLYLTYSITENLKIGLGAFVPYGSAVKWEDDWRGRFLIQSMLLRNFCFQPTVSYKISDKLGIGAGFVVSTATVKLTKALNFVENSTVELKSDADVAYGFNIGLMYKFSDKLSLGIDYRSKIDLEIGAGDATFDFGDNVFYNSLFGKESKFSSDISTPANLDIGLAYKVSDKLLVAIEFDYIFWSTHKTLDFAFTGKAKALDNQNPRHYNDSYVIRIGAEYKFSEKMTMRFGSYYDRSPLDKHYFTPSSVNLNSLGLTFGASFYPTEHLTIDISYIHLSGFEGDRSYKPENFSGSYKSITSIPGIGIQYKF